MGKTAAAMWSGVEGRGEETSRVVPERESQFRPRRSRLVKNPEVEVQVGADVFAARARTATAREKLRLWKLMTSIWPEYDPLPGQDRASHPGRDLGATLRRPPIS
jgi:hypothetical protein